MYSTQLTKYIVFLYINILGKDRLKEIECLGKGQWFQISLADDHNPSGREKSRRHSIAE